MYQTKNLGLNITEIDKDKLQPFNFDTDLGDNFKAIDEKTLSHRNITNCLLEVPQDFKIELIDGVLTLKEGSKVYVPNGFESDGTTPKFDSVMIQNDINITLGTNWVTGNYLVCYNLTSDGFIIRKLHASGNTAPSDEYIIFYDITNNTCRDTTIEVNEHILSLPIATLAVENSSEIVISIDQVFNGYGYIGSILFELPGVKGLITEGINDDGTLKAVIKTTSKVAIDPDVGPHSNSIISNLEGDIEATVWLGESDTHPSTEGVVASPRYLNTRTNFIQLDAGITGDWKNQYGYLQVFEDLKVDPTGKILSITPKKPFRAVDHNNYIQKITELETKIATLEAAVEALQGS